MPDPARSSSAANRSLWIVLAAVIVVFPSATAVSQYSSSRIELLASTIALNAAPSVQELSAARTDLRHLEALLAAYTAESDANPENRRAIDAMRSNYAEHIVRYLNLPILPGERDRWTEVSRGLDHLNDTVTRILTLVDTGHHELARATVATQLNKDVDVASDGLQASIDFDAQDTSRLAVEIERLRLRMGRIAFGLDVLCACLTVLGGLLLRRTLNRSTALVQAHASELERRNHELEMFSSRVAHDIVSPLAAASTALDFAEARGKDDAKVRAMLAAGKRRVVRVRRIVDALLDFARSGARPPADARAELDEVVGDVLEGLQDAAESAGVQISLHGDVHRSVRCTHGALTSVVSNLVGNAIKYMGGSTTRRIEIRIHDREAGVRVEVADSGPGLPLGLEHQSLFEPYVRDPSSGLPGLGLGLATVRRIVRAHGGEVGVESVPGRGTTFWFELLRCSAPAVHASAPLVAH